MGFIAQHAWSVLTIPNTPPGVTLLVPGVTVPWEAIFSIIIIAIVHEVAHGVLANIEKVKIKASGALLFGFLPVGAFVEPDETVLARKPLHTKRRVLAAGSISNIAFFFVFLALTLAAGFAFNATVDRVVVSSSNSSLAIGAALTSFASSGEAEAFFMQSAASGNAAALIEVNGIEESVRFSELQVIGVRSDYPSSHLFEEGNLILSVDSERVSGLNGLKDALANKQEGDEVLIGTVEGVDLITLGPNAQMGVTLSPVMLFELEDEPNNAVAYAIASFVLVVFSFAYVLNFILATVNLLPLFITDGHRIIYEELKEAFGQEKAERLSFALGVLALLLLAVNAAPWLWA
jgi:membrane-associated protease RseP (regulator of RpoE activity)